VLTGRVTSDLEARVFLAFVGSAGRVPVEAMIDTGFNGHVTVSPELAVRLGLIDDGIIETELGDGTAVMLRKFVGIVEWHDETRAVMVIEGGDQSLVGMSLLAGSSVTIDVRPGGKVAISEAAAE
jgi:predicted aspartyl protease